VPEVGWIVAFPEWLKTHYPNNESMGASHEAIYRSLSIQARGVLKRELMLLTQNTKTVFYDITRDGLLFLLRSSQLPSRDKKPLGLC